MFKTICRLGAICAAFFFLFIGQTVYAEGNYKVWNDGSTYAVNSDKIWTVTFNRNVDINTAKDSIKVYESDDNSSIPVDISMDDGDKLKISPKEPYKEGKAYVLNIDDNLKDTNGYKLDQPVKCNFKIIRKSVGNAIDINDYTEYYNVVKKAIMDYDSQLVLYIEDYDEGTYNLDVIDSIMNDSPDLRAWYERASGTIQSEDGSSVEMTINFKYEGTKDELTEKNKEVNDEVKRVVNSVTNPAMKDYEKELALHDYVVNNARYDERADVDVNSIPEDSYTAYGILINGVGVCQGYADAMYRLLHEAGIENKMVVGEANNGTGWIGHAWNIVKIQGEYYQLDATWDDPVSYNGSNVLAHSYFNVTDSRLSRDHRWDRSQYPACDSQDYNYSRIMQMYDYRKSAA
ncbi:MAG: Ig-like domain-containing protein [Clostridium sp.]|uniref:transglutaminase domain-containing protein n=1 Tax=Clostridium sp. TaxID=1506 RepID=UPI0025B97E9D|nr:transglutaminase domain-containing protein [Clostridium sp.]MCH3964378.1 Ig-like domain-containing protein [Clostridium sp.]MCI1715553.1 Ig-like domain-containing protein [Clostridium sp.]MCI1799655.1 Ig-like domain-containing protein [Clostridium sp.]MCI1813737.1 Ig-like domain-containing protein [Clostridium sp.]MCI1870468.1 Ig-like domain-containing protein [Clostridium sp.]